MLTLCLYGPDARHTLGYFNVCLLRLNHNSRALLGPPGLVLSDDEHVEQRTERPYQKGEEVVIMLPRIEDQRPESTGQPPD